MSSVVRSLSALHLPCSFGAVTHQKSEGPIISYTNETAAERKEAEQGLHLLNTQYEVDHQVLLNQFNAEEAQKPASKCRKHVSKSETILKKHHKGLKEGINWYHYHQHILLPKLLPFCYEIIQEFGVCFLVEDGASPHITRENKEDYEIQGLTYISWPPNSSDLNVIEQTWHYLKQKERSLSYPVTKIEHTKQSYDML